MARDFVAYAFRYRGNFRVDAERRSRSTGLRANGALHLRPVSHGCLHLRIDEQDADNPGELGGERTLGNHGSGCSSSISV